MYFIRQGAGEIIKNETEGFYNEKETRAHYGNSNDRFCTVRTVAFASEADDTAAAEEETKDDAAGGDTMTMDEVKAAVQKSDVPSDLKLDMFFMNLCKPMGCTGG